jgi:hypothetical protein
MAETAGGGPTAGFATPVGGVPRPTSETKKIRIKIKIKIKIKRSRLTAATASP